MPPFRFQENLVPGFLRKPHNLVFDGRTIARPHPFDLPAVDRGLIKISPDQGMTRLGGAGDVTQHLLPGDRLGQS